MKRNRPATVEPEATTEVVVRALPEEASTAYRPGDRDDFDRLYRASYHRILFTLTGVLRNRTAAEDCTQEAFVRAFRAWPRWQPDAPAEAWLHRIALNVAISYRRSQRLREVGEVIRRFGLGPPPRAVGAMDAADLLMEALRRMPRAQASIIVLRHHHGYSNREIAHALRTPESTVASRLAAAKQRLTRELRQLDADDGDLVGRASSRVVSGGGPLA